MTERVKRSLIRTYLNTTSTTGAVYSLVGVGVSTGTINMNPKTTEETYIHEDTATMTVDSYAPQMPINMTATDGDPVFEFVDDLRQDRAVLDAAETDIVNVWMYPTSTASTFACERQPVAIQIDDFGGDGGTPAKINFTFLYQGSPTAGSFNISNKTFV
jgi:hypothetical protein